MPPYVKIGKKAVTHMARPKVYTINLTEDERAKLNKAIKNKATSKTILKRCQILRDLDEIKGCGLTRGQIAHTYAVCPATVSNIIRDYVQKGIDSIIRYHINPNSAASLRKADGRAEAKLIQIACGPAPDGHSKWTLRLLEEKARVELETPISRETIRRVLKKTNSSLIEMTTGVSHQRKTPNL